ncbi:MAG TPA: helix-hairpin-helix domain-containing protein [Acidimicrobiales bacterium]|nr:helix-hairpin-helix domain-containing protein [Acidimicrobiales bacterium]
MQRQPSDVEVPEPADRARVPIPTAIAVSLHRLELTYRFARNHPVRVAATVLAIALVGVVAWRLVAAPAVGAPEAQLPLATRSVTSAGALAGSTSRGSEVVVHVAGAVVSPGVFRLSDGSRTVDAISAAGGARGDADVARVNLAARLSDGLRVYVPMIGEAAAPLVDGASDATSQGPINLNAATADQLDALPGVGPSTATAIVAYRRDHGPFSSVEQLLDVPGIGPSKLAQIRTLIVV